METTPIPFGEPATEQSAFAEETISSLFDEPGAPEALAHALAPAHERHDEEDPLDPAIFAGLVTP